MAEENVSQEFRLKNIDETRNYFLEGIKENELMSKRHRKVCTILNYIDHFLVLASTNNYWMYFNFCFHFFDWYSNRNYEFCNRIKNFSNNCSN